MKKMQEIVTLIVVTLIVIGLVMIVKTFGYTGLGWIGSFTALLGIVCMTMEVKNFGSASIWIYAAGVLILSSVKLLT